MVTSGSTVKNVDTTRLRRASNQISVKRLRRASTIAQPYKARCIYGHKPFVHKKGRRRRAFGAIRGALSIKFHNSFTSYEILIIFLFFAQLFLTSYESLFGSTFPKGGFIRPLTSHFRFDLQWLNHNFSPSPVDSPEEVTTP
jgi:hypothetical protein